MVVLHINPLLVLIRGGGSVGFSIGIGQTNMHNTGGKGYDVTFRIVSLRTQGSRQSQAGQGANAGDSHISLSSHSNDHCIVSILNTIYSHLSLFGPF